MGKPRRHFRSGGVWRAFVLAAPEGTRTRGAGVSGRKPVWQGGMCVPRRMTCANRSKVFISPQMKNALIFLAILVLFTRFGSAQSELSFQFGWEKQRTAIPEFFQLLAPHVQPKVDLKSDDSVEIFDGITYLMPLDEARLKIGGGKLATVVASGRCIAAGFPAGSINVVEFRGSFGEGFPILILLTDLKKQVVAVELVDKSPTEKTLRGHVVTKAYYDFVTGKRKAVTSYRIAQKSQVIQSVIQVDSELLDGDEKLREKTRLLMPDKFASIVLSLLK